MDVDVEIEQQLRDALLKLFACDLWGEETGHVLTGCRWCWVVDPNDGTSEFFDGPQGLGDLGQPPARCAPGASRRVRTHV